MRRWPHRLSPPITLSCPYTVGPNEDDCDGRFTVTVAREDGREWLESVQATCDHGAEDDEEPIWRALGDME